MYSLYSNFDNLESKHTCTMDRIFTSKPFESMNEEDKDLNGLYTILVPNEELFKKEDMNEKFEEIMRSQALNEAERELVLLINEKVKESGGSNYNVNLLRVNTYNKKAFTAFILDRYYPYLNTNKLEKYVHIKTDIQCVKDDGDNYHFNISVKSIDSNENKICFTHFYWNLNVEEAAEKISALILSITPTTVAYGKNEGVTRKEEADKIINLIVEEYKEVEKVTSSSKIRHGIVEVLDYNNFYTTYKIDKCKTFTQFLFLGDNPPPILFGITCVNLESLYEILIENGCKIENNQFIL